MYKYLLTTIMCLASFAMQAYDLPTTAKGKPKLFENERESHKWEKCAEQRNWGEFSMNPWIVYAAVDGAIAYTSPSETSVQEMTIGFMEDFYVADLQGDFAQLFYYDSRLNGLQIPEGISKKKSEAKKNSRKNGYVGWVKVDDLLLWTSCPRNNKGIYKKVAIVKDLKKVKKDNVNKVPNLYKDEKCQIPTGNSVSGMEFYFRYKTNKDGNALVSTDYKTDARMTNKKVGWIEAQEFINWDTRICWEPSFESDKNDNAYTYNTNDAAYDYNNRELTSKTKLDKRKEPQFPRSPILNFRSDIAELAVIGNLNEGGTSIEDAIRIQKEIEKLERSMATINVVFVMDASNSMDKCFPAMSNAVDQITQYRYAKDMNIKYGAVAFRNYKDEASGNLVQMCQLTDDAQKVVGFLKNVKCFSAEKVEPREAMFYGLKYAAENMNWKEDESNFIILISDVMSEDPDKKGITTKTIINTLCDKKINLVAFQARSQQDAPYQNFSSQLTKIIKGTLNQLGYNAAPREDISHIFMYEQSDTWPLRPMGYRWKNSNDQTIKPQELTEMATDVIKEFISKTDDNIALLRSKVGGGTGQNFDASICEALIRKGIIRKCEDLNGLVKVTGYSQMFYSNDKRMFTPCVFMAETELNDLIQDLSKATKNSSSKRRQELQKQCLQLILTYTGQKINADALSDSQATASAIDAIEQECRYEFYKDVKNIIENPMSLDDDEVDVVVKRLKDGIEKLQNVQNDPTSRLEQNGKKYYYVLLEDMPLVTKY